MTNERVCTEVFRSIAVSTSIVLITLFFTEVGIALEQHSSLGAVMNDKKLIEPANKDAHP